MNREKTPSYVPEVELTEEPSRPPAAVDNRYSHVQRVLAVLALATLSVYVLVQAKAVLVPIAFAALFAMLLLPAVTALAKYVPRGLAIGVVALGLFGLLCGVSALLGQQLAGFSDDLPQIQDKGAELLSRATTWVSNTTDYSERRIENKLEDQFSSATSGLIAGAQSGLSNATAFFTDLLLFFVYLVLILSQTGRLRTFVEANTPERDGDKADRTLGRVRAVAGDYIRARGLLIAILGVVYAVGFWWGDLRFPFVIAGIAALMSLVPYVGNVVAAALVLVVAALSEDFATTAAVTLGTMALAQVLESYVLTPLLVGSGVDLNPLSTVVAVIAFSAIWGLPGAILAIPLVAILRQVLQALPHGRSWAYLLSDQDEIPDLV